MARVGGLVVPVYVSLTSGVAVSLRVRPMVTLSPHGPDRDDRRLTERREHVQEPHSAQAQNSSEGVVPRGNRVFQIPVSGEITLKNTEQRQEFLTVPEASAGLPPRPTLANPRLRDVLLPLSQPDRPLPCSAQAAPVQIKDSWARSPHVRSRLLGPALRPVLFQTNHLLPYFSF